MMKATVDRTEENLIVLITENGECVNMDKRLCPEAREGDIVTIEVDANETEKRKSEIENKLKLLKNRTFDK